MEEGHGQADTPRGPKKKQAKKKAKKPFGVGSTDQTDIPLVAEGGGTQPDKKPKSAKKASLSQASQGPRLPRFLLLLSTNNHSRTECLKNKEEDLHGNLTHGSSCLA